MHTLMRFHIRIVASPFNVYSVRDQFLNIVDYIFNLPLLHWCKTGFDVGNQPH